MPTACVVGAGVSGLQTARALTYRGISCTVLEEGSSVGGAWASSNPALKLQTSKKLYEFGELPWKQDCAEEQPAAQDVLSYIQRYAEQYNLNRLIRFNSRLRSASLNAANQWVITYVNRQGGCLEVLTADYLVVCTGLHGQPSMPTYKGAEQFKGQQLHARDLAHPSQVERKRVLVVGVGRSVQECAAQEMIAGAAASVAWVFRQVSHWPCPRQLASGTKLEQLLHSLLPLLLAPSYYTSAGTSRAVLRMLQPLRKLTWKRLEKALQKQYRLEGVMKPSLPLVNDLLYAGRVLTEGWYGQIDHGEVEDHARLRSLERTAVVSKLLGGWWKRRDSNSSTSARSSLSHHNNEFRGTSRNSMLTPRRSMSGTPRKFTSSRPSSRRSTEVEQTDSAYRRHASFAAGAEQCSTPGSRRGSAATDTDSRSIAAAGAASAAMEPVGSSSRQGGQPTPSARARRHSLAIMESMSADSPTHTPRHSRTGPEDERQRPSNSGSSSPSRRRASVHTCGYDGSYVDGNGRRTQVDSPRSGRARRHSMLMVEVGGSSSREPEMGVNPSSSTSSRTDQQRTYGVSEHNSPRRRSSMGQAAAGISGGGSSSSSASTPRTLQSSRSGGNAEHGRFCRAPPRRHSLLVTSSSDYPPRQQALDGKTPATPGSSNSSGSRQRRPVARRHSMVMEGFAGYAEVVTKESLDSPRSPQHFSPRDGVSGGRARRFSLPLQHEFKASLLGPRSGEADLGVTPHQQQAGDDSPRRLSAASDLAVCQGSSLGPSTPASKPRRASLLLQHLSSLLPEGSRCASEAGSNLGLNDCRQCSSVAVTEDAGTSESPTTAAMRCNITSSSAGTKEHGQMSEAAAVGDPVAPQEQGTGISGGSSTTHKPPAGKNGRRPISVIIPGSDPLLSASSGEEGGSTNATSAPGASPFAAAANTASASSSTFEEGGSAGHTPSTSCASPRRVAMMQRMQRLVTGVGNWSLASSLHAQTSSDLQQALGLPQDPEGSVKVRPMYREVSQFTPYGVLLDNGEYVPADLVVYCTGYVKSYDWLDGPSRNRLGLQKDGLYLYRNVLPPQLPRLAFVGSEVSTFNNILTAGLQAEWLAQHWAGGAQLPTPEEMAEDVRQQMMWRRQLMPAQRARSTVYQLYGTHYHRQLVKDMGLTPPRFQLLHPLAPGAASAYRAVFQRSSSGAVDGCSSPASAAAAAAAAEDVPGSTGVPVLQRLLTNERACLSPRGAAAAAAAITELQSAPQSPKRASGAALTAADAPTATATAEAVGAGTTGCADLQLAVAGVLRGGREALQQKQEPQCHQGSDTVAAPALASISCGTAPEANAPKAIANPAFAPQQASPVRIQGVAGTRDAASQVVEGTRAHDVDIQLLGGIADSSGQGPSVRTPRAMPALQQEQEQQQEREQQQPGSLTGGPPTDAGVHLVQDTPRVVSPTLQEAAEVPPTVLQQQQQQQQQSEEAQQCWLAEVSQSTENQEALIPAVGVSPRHPVGLAIVTHQEGVQDASSQVIAAAGQRLRRFIGGVSSSGRAVSWADNLMQTAPDAGNQTSPTEPVAAGAAAPHHSSDGASEMSRALSMPAGAGLGSVTEARSQNPRRMMLAGLATAASMPTGQASGLQLSASGWAGGLTSAASLPAGSSAGVSSQGALVQPRSALKSSGGTSSSGAAGGGGTSRRSSWVCQQIPLSMYNSMAGDAIGVTPARSGTPSAAAAAAAASVAVPAAGAPQCTTATEGHLPTAAATDAAAAGAAGMSADSYPRASMGGRSAAGSWAAGLDLLPPAVSSRECASRRRSSVCDNPLTAVRCATFADPLAPVKALVRTLQEQATADSQAGRESACGFPSGAHSFSAAEMVLLPHSGSPQLPKPVSAKRISSMASVQEALQATDWQQQQQHQGLLQEQQLVSRQRSLTAAAAALQEQQQQQQAKPQGSVAPCAIPWAASMASPKAQHLVGRDLNRSLTAGTAPGSPSTGASQLAKAVSVNSRSHSSAAPALKAPPGSSGAASHVRVREWLHQMELCGPQEMVNPDHPVDDPAPLTGSVSSPALEEGFAEGCNELLPAATATVEVRGLPSDPVAKARQEHLGQGATQAN